MARRADRDRLAQRALASGHSQITQIAGDQHVYPTGSGPAPRALAALPAAPGRLVGRDDEILDLLDLLDPRRPGAAVCAVAGLAGVGKTALALHVAHEAAVVRGWFPGGQLFVDLRGYDPDEQVTVGQALGAWLRALAVRDGDLPPTEPEQAGLYQSELARLAEAGKPVLLVADNASTAAQVEALIPARSEHRLLVTSRDILASIPARLIDLDVLAAPAAADLIARVLTSARPSDRRVLDEAAALQQVAELCGRLPLALQITAEILKADPGLPAAAMAAELQDPPVRLAALSREDGTGRTRAVRAAFEASYRRLAAEQARLFRLLSLNPGPDTATEAAAALAGAPAGQVRPLLAALAAASLATEQPLGGNRWRMHDLIRLYATELARDDQSEAALDRLLEHYLDTADAADDHLRALPSQAVPERFDGRTDALAWLDAERPTLVAAVTLAAASGRADTAVSLASCLAVFLDWRRHFDDMITTGQAAVDSAHQAGDRDGEATALTNLGGALQKVRRFDEAITADQQAAALFTELGDRHGEGIALGNLGSALEEVRRFDEAITADQQALAICRELGDRDGEATALRNLGGGLEKVRRFDEAITADQQALAICRELGDRHGEAKALRNLGGGLEKVRRFDEAITADQRAAALFTELGDRHGEGIALGHLGSALEKVRRFDEAITADQRAAALFTELGDRHGEGIALGHLGSALQEVRRFDEAITADQRAAALFTELGDRHSEGIALNNLGHGLEKVRRFDEAITAYQQAAALFTELGDRHGEAMALNNLGRALQQSGRADRMKRIWRVLTGKGSEVHRKRPLAIDPPGTPPPRPSAQDAVSHNLITQSR
jgi:tetratricopeptide (TPR) repeat protein